MIIKIEDELFNKLNISPEQAKLDLAIGLFLDKKVTLGQGARLASLNQSQFLKELGKRKIPIHYDIDEFNKDIETLSKINL